jgi:hypothetical protein
VTMALPPALRTLIGFATYHHNPYQSPYTITGTTRDSTFRFAPEEYMSYFILNAFENKISTITQSAYRQYVSQYFFENNFLDKLSDFYKVCNRLIQVDDINYQFVDLEAVTHFYMTIYEDRTKFTNPLAKTGIRYFMNYLKNVSEPKDGDIGNLAIIIDLYGKELLSGSQTPSIRDYCTALQLNKQVNDDYLDRISLDIDILKMCVLQGNEHAGIQLHSTYRVIYPLEDISRIVSHAEFLNDLMSSMLNVSIKIHILIWKCLLSFVKLNITNHLVIQEMIRTSIRVAVTEAGINAESPTSLGKELIEIIVDVFKADRKVCIEAFSHQEQTQWNTGLAWLYYQTVQDVPIEKRQPYRLMLGTRRYNYETYEIRCEARRSPPRQTKILIQRWITDSEWDPSQRRNLLNQAIDAVWFGGDMSSLSTIAEECLMDQGFLQALTEQNLSLILKSYFPEYGFRTLTSEQLVLFTRFVVHTSLSANQKAVIGGSYAMNTGSFLTNSPKIINDYLEKLSEERYREEVEKLISRFFRSSVELSSHLELLSAAYIYRYEGIFWEVYWDQFVALLLYPARASDFVNLMNFWFDQSFTVFAETPYIGQQFFLQLPEVISSASEKKKEFREATFVIMAKARQYNWYKLVSAQFEPQKKIGFFGLRLKK